MVKDSTFYDRVVIWFKNHRFFACIFLVAALVIGAGSFIDSLEKIITISTKYADYIKIKTTRQNEPPVILPTIPKQSSSYRIWKSNLNRDYKKRDKILGINVAWNKQPGGAVQFDELDLNTIASLLANKFMDPGERQNQSPAVKDFVTFLANNSAARAHGYAVSPNREDYRVTLEGIEIKKANITKDIKIAFFEFCKTADEIDTENDLRCWWD